MAANRRMMTLGMLLLLLGLGVLIALSPAVIGYRYGSGRWGWLFSKAIAIVLTWQGEQAGPWPWNPRIL